MQKILLTLAVSALLFPLFAQDITWDGGGDGFTWADPDNWNPNTVPTSTDDVLVDQNVNFRIQENTNAEALSLTLTNGAFLTIDIGGNNQFGTLTIAGSTADALTLDGGGTGLETRGELTITNAGGKGVVIKNGASLKVDRNTTTITNPGSNGIQIESNGDFTVTQVSTANILQAGMHGISGLDFCSINNFGQLNIDMSTDDAIHLANTALFENKEGELHISNASGDGIDIASTASATNSSEIIFENITGDAIGGSGSFTNNESGTVKGDGTMVSDVFDHNDGTIAPGNSPGIITFDGDENFVNSNFNIELKNAGNPPVAGADFDKIIVNGAATVDTSTVINVTLIDDYTPALDDEFKIMSCTSITGTPTINTPAGCMWDVTVSDSTITVKVTETGCTADALVVAKNSGAAVASNTTSGSLVLQIPGGTNRMLVVTGFAFDNVPHTIMFDDNDTFDDAALTEYAQSCSDNCSSIFYLPLGTGFSTTGTLSLNTTNSSSVIFISAVILLGVDQTTPISDDDSNGGNIEATLDASVNSKINDLVLSMLNFSSGDNSAPMISPGSDQSLIGNFAFNNWAQLDFGGGLTDVSTTFTNSAKAGASPTVTVSNDITEDNVLGGSMFALNIQWDGSTLPVYVTPADAGTDQIDICSTSTSLNANSPNVEASETGMWSIISGTGGSFLDDTDPTTTFSGMLGETYVLEWTIRQGVNEFPDQVSIVFNDDSDNDGVCDLEDTCPGIDDTSEACNSSCPSTRTIMDADVASDVYLQADQTITTSGVVTIENSLTVTLQAGTSITLSNGFSALAGSNFTAQIDPCSGGAFTNPAVEARTDAEDSDTFNKTVQLTVAPNPFDSYTNLNFELPEKATVTLRLLNAFGQEVARPYNEVRFAAGQHQYALDAQQLTSGFYFVQLTTNATQVVRTIILSEQ